MYQELKTNPQYQDIPVIMLSGVDAASFSHSLKMMNAAAGMTLPEPDAYMEKPPRPERLLDIVRRILDC
jgi:CheY-like chemotaxis protein